MKKFLLPLVILLVAATGLNFKPSGIPCQSYSLHGVILLQNKHNLVIQGDSINGAHASCIKLINCTNIRILNCKLMNTDKDTAKGVDIRNSQDILVQNCYVSNVAIGVYANGSRRITVTQNDMLNMKSSTTGDFVQFVNVNGGGSSITKNHCENISGSSTPQDGIDLQNCSGLAFAPIWVTYNYIRGGGPSKTGSGIKLGDGGGTGQVAENNILVNTGTYGIYIAGGAAGIKVLSNTIFSKQIAHVSYAAIKAAAYTVTPTITGNRAKWRDSSNVERDTTHQVGKASPIGWSVNTVNASIDSSVLAKQLLKPCNHISL